MGIDTLIKWYDGLIYKKPINRRAIAPRIPYSELLLFEFSF